MRRLIECLVRLLFVATIFVVARENIARSQTPTLPTDPANFETISPSRSILSLDHSSLTIFSSGCVRTDSMIRYTVLGSSQQGDSIIAIKLIGSANFQPVSAPALPSPVGGLDSICIGYSSQGLQPDTAVLVLSYLLNGSPFDTSIILIGVNPGPAVEARPQLLVAATTTTSPQQTKGIATDVGSVATIGVTVNHDLPLMQVDSIEVSYAYNDDIVTPDKVTAAPGYIANIEQAFGGLVRFRLIRDLSAPQSKDLFSAANQLLATVSYRTTLSREASTTIQLDQFTYYLNPTLGTGCAAQAVLASDSVRVTLNPRCGDGQLTELMNKFNALHILSIYPNPSGSSSQVIQVTFDLQTDTRVTVSVTDANGKEVSKLFDNELTVGQHSVGLSSSGIPDGVYFIIVVVNGQREIRKVIVQK